ncbi:MAG TPA: PQQ-dependent sugar dehydrogenase [Candidatus Eremiobacteraceae bacterium]|nr:PQQ-dependent sugar dehydrogenase [Candidatus Eremiobacteraceae bacterium]
MALNLLPGFKITMVAENVPGARFMTVAPNGDLIISETGNGQVVAIKAGAPYDAPPTVLASGLQRPHGLGFHGNDLYIATWTGFSVIKNYPAGTTTQTLYNGLPQNGDHNNRSLAIAPDGSIFESSGSDTNLGNEGSQILATIIHANGDGSNPQIYATGVRNGSGLAFDQSGQLWMVVNQRDDLPPNHTDLPVDEFDKVVAGGNYGWPQCYPDLTGARQINPDLATPAPNCNGQLPTTQPLQAHSAPLGIVFYYGSMFPATYKGGAFVAFHGSWDRSPPTGYKVVFVPFAGGVPGAPMDFVSGWLTPGNSVTGRPVGLAVGPDGSLYISDDSNGYIYRVTYG